jgi:hypothetical protein
MAIAKYLEKSSIAQAKAAEIVNGMNILTKPAVSPWEWLKKLAPKSSKTAQTVKWVEEDETVRES